MEFECLNCGKTWECDDWDFGDTVTCPHCGAEHDTDWDTDSDDNIYGPWITGLTEQEGGE